MAAIIQYYVIALYHNMPATTFIHLITFLFHQILFIFLIHWQSKKLHTRLLPKTAFCFDYICCGIVSTTLCNVTTFISIQSYIHFWLRFCIYGRRVRPFLQTFSLSPFNGVKPGLCGGQFMCENDSSCSTLSQVEPLHCFLGICPSHQGRNNLIDRITWSLSTFRNFTDLQSLDLTNWSNPRA